MAGAAKLLMFGTRCGAVELSVQSYLALSTHYKAANGWAVPFIDGRSLPSTGGPLSACAARRLLTTSCRAAATRTRWAATAPPT